MPSCKLACAASLIAYVDDEDAETWGENTLQHSENCSLCGMFDELKRVDIRIVECRDATAACVKACRSAAEVSPGYVVECHAPTGCDT